MAGPQRKPQPDIYTVLLAIALVAMIICVILMYMETSDYGQNKTSGVPTVVQLETPTTLNVSEAFCCSPIRNHHSWGLASPQTITNEMHGCSIDFASGKQT